jgi:hypothetical protein
MYRSSQIQFQLKVLKSVLGQEGGTIKVRLHLPGMAVSGRIVGGEDREIDLSEKELCLQDAYVTTLVGDPYSTPQLAVPYDSIIALELPDYAPAIGAGVAATLAC